MLNKISWIPYKFMIFLGRKNKKDCVNLKINPKKKDKIIFFVNEEDWGLSSQLKIFGFREPINSEYYYNFIDEKDIVLDIGANIGYFTLLSKNAKRIICVEPIKKILPLLKKNIEKNGLKEKCVVINKIISKKGGDVFFETKKELNFSKITKKENEKTEKIDSVSLKEIIKKYNPNTLRMDLEGYEYELLMKNIPKEIKKISLEFHTWLLKKKEVNEFMDYLEKEGFRIKYLTEDIPLRLYPFYKIFKKMNSLSKISYVKKNLNPKKDIKEIFRGRRQLKYLFLERK